MFRLLFSLIPFLPLFPDPAVPPVNPAPSNPTPPADPPKPGDGKPEGITPEMEAYFGRVIAKERKEAEDKAAQREKDRLAQEQKDKDDQAERDRLAKAGEFQKIEDSLKADLKAAQDKVTSTESELTTLQELVKKDLEARIAKLPEPLVALRPEDASITEIVSWLEKAEAQAEKLSPGPTNTTPIRRPGNHGNPPPRTPEQGAEEANRQKARYAGKI